MHGLPTIGTIGFGWFEVSGRRRVPSPPAITTALISPTSARALRAYDDRRRGSRAPKPIQKSTSGQSALGGVSITKREARVEHPGRDLAEHVHLEAVAAADDERRREHQDDVARRDQQRDPRQPVDVPEQDHRHVDQEPVGERVGDPAERRLDVPAAGEEAVDLVGDRRRRRRARRPASSGRRPTARISTATTGITASRAIVSAFGSCASGAETVRAATAEGYGLRLARPGAGPRATRAAARCARLPEQLRPPRRAAEICRFGSHAAEPPGAVVGAVAVRAAAAPADAAGSICVPSCHSLNDVIVTRSAPARIAALPHRVVGPAVAARLHPRVAGRPLRVVARADRRRAEQAARVRLPAEAREQRRRRRRACRRCRRR